MQRFNVLFLTVNLLLLAGLLYVHFTAQAREQRQFNLLKPLLMKSYQNFNMKLPHEDPKNLDELVAPLEAITAGLSK
jgi:hypothetical protein